MSCVRHAETHRRNTPRHTQVLELLRVASVALLPVAPGLCARVYLQLGFSREQFEAVQWADAAWGGLKKGQATAPPSPVFGRLEGDMVTEAPPPPEPKKPKKKKGGGGGGGQAKKEQQQQPGAEAPAAA